MKKFLTVFLVSMFVLPTTASAASHGGALQIEPDPESELAGDWLGELDVGPNTLRLVLTVDVADDGALEGTLNSVDQDAIIPVSAIALDDGVLRFRMPAIGASFEGAVSAEGDAIEGTWSQSGLEFPLTFERLSEPWALQRPQERVSRPSSSSPDGTGSPRPRTAGWSGTGSRPSPGR